MTPKPKSTPSEAGALAAKRLLEASIRQINSIDVNTDSDSLTLAEGVKGIRQAFDALENSSSMKADVEKLKRMKGEIENIRWRINNIVKNYRSSKVQIIRSVLRDALKREIYELDSILAILDNAIFNWKEKQDG